MVIFHSYVSLPEGNDLAIHMSQPPLGNVSPQDVGTVDIPMSSVHFSLSLKANVTPTGGLNISSTKF